MRNRNDYKLEELLKKLPKVTDNRQPNEIYKNINMKRKKVKVPNWLFPTAAFTVVGSLLFILSPTIIGWQNDKNHSEIAQTSIDTSLEEETAKEENFQTLFENGPLMYEEEISDTENQHMMDVSTVEPTSVYAADLEGYQAFTFPIPDKNAQVLVPVTVMIGKAQNKTWFEQFQDTMGKLKEEEWGLANYYPLNAKLDYNEANQTVQVDLPSNHGYGRGSASETMFIATLKNLFPQEKVKKIIFTTDGQKGIMLGNYSEQHELDNFNTKRHAYFFLYDGEKERPYIVPTEDAFDNIAEALAEMGMDQDELGLKASLPKEVNIDFSSVEQGSETLKLKVAEGSKLNEDFVYSIEAISLTAKTFGYTTVKLESADVEQIGPFNLTEDIYVPVAPNKKIMNVD
ncbi:negative regulator of sigma-X activity [Bacillus sp. B15-48]|uniref:negative regulator of sigma-X activity n=1 Tax=Bacillus sp. B15-48 TaxID=1548601 RepID=UPI001940163A|nr:negative regulator of sigma-X activity [Bacillus sp. B15-48]MBM4762160.1 negative regulator of sigma-X activity [Bacillus sp. B15-48]